MNQWWAVLCAWGIILLRAGMTLHETGSLRSKNSASAILRNLADLCIAAIAFWAIGGAIFFAQGAAFGVDRPYVAGSSMALLPKLLFGATAVFIATGIVGGTLAERSRLTPILVCSLVLGALVVPVAGLWTQGGWLRRLGFHDLAGASFLHIVGGVFGLVGSIFVGPRLGKYNRDGSSNAIPGHSVPLAAVGAMVILAGSMPYLSGFGIVRYLEPPMASIGMNALLSAAAGALAAMYISHVRYGKADVHLTISGLLGGVIAISAGADVVPGWAAIVIGAVAGVLVPMLGLAIDLMWHVDDPTSGIAIHGIGGAWGVLAAGIFQHGAGARWKGVGVQALGLVAIAAMAAVVAVAVFAALKAMMRLRASEADEFDGLDLAEHDIGAYPDFQQTMIKSYHLREA